jgi:RNA polymerase II subunit A small phosphatase-like protein
MDDVTRKLLVLDLDETLVHATERRLAHEGDFRVGPYHVYRRPHLAEFISAMMSTFRLAVWTSSSPEYARPVIDRIFPPDTLEFVWTGERCTTARDWETGEYKSLKNLRKLKDKGYRLESVIAVDDTPEKYERSFGNLVTVREFLGDPADAELKLLSAYLKQLALVPNVRAVEKRLWRERVVLTED